jgi:hypothetical protein
VLGDRRHKSITWIEEDANLAHDPHDFADGYKAIPFAVAVGRVPKDLRTYEDKHGNERYYTPDRYKLMFNVRFNRLNGIDIPVSYRNHIEDLDWLVENEYGGIAPSDIFLESDSGSEADYHSLKALTALGEFFRRQKVSVMIVSGSASEDSSGNDIERLFSQPKKRINNLQIPDLVGNDTVSPMHQPDLKDDERILKDQTIYTSCGESLKSAWEDLIVGGEPVSVRYTVPKVSISLLVRSIHFVLKILCRKRT